MLRVAVYLGSPGAGPYNRQIAGLVYEGYWNMPCSRAEVRDDQHSAKNMQGKAEDSLP